MKENNAVEELNLAADSSFNLDGVIHAKKVLSRLKKEKILIQGEFNEDLWIVEHEFNKGNHIHLNFEKLNSIIFKKSSLKHLKKIIKCWTTYLLDNYSNQTVQGSLNHVIKFTVETYGYQADKVVNFLDKIDYSDRKSSTKKVLLSTVYNFLDYSELINMEDVMAILQKYQSKLDPRSGVRMLPPPYWIFEFDRIVYDFFNKLHAYEQSEEINRLKCLYFPIKIWWNLTTIIPIRPSEFCLIERNCLSFTETKEGKLYYIKLPRKKLKKVNKNNIQIMDQILISPEIYYEINNYIDFTNQYGETKTLISYNSLAATDINNHWHRNNQKKNLDYFSNQILYHLLHRFYNEIIEKKYNVLVKKENRLTPIHTRHIAFVNLMLQGVPPIERARLGGHQTITAQFHYSYHVEQWVDTEVFKLMTQYQNWGIESRIEEDQMSPIFVPENIKAKAYTTISHSFKKKLKDVGYCTDKLQRCQSKECILCDYWGISPDELEEKSEVIVRKLLNRRNEIKEIVSVLENIERQLLTNELSGYDPSFQTKHMTTINGLNAKIKQISMIQAKTGLLGGKMTSWDKEGEI